MAPLHERIANPEHPKIFIIVSFPQAMLLGSDGVRGRFCDLNQNLRQTADYRRVAIFR
jgi:hypothetical protein